MDLVRRLGVITACGEEFADDLPAIHLRDESARRCPAGCSCRRAATPSGNVLREVVFVEQQRPAAGLPDDEVELPGIAEVRRHDRAAIAIAVRAASGG